MRQTPHRAALMRAVSYRQPPPDGLLDMPSMSRQWRSLQELADDPDVCRARGTGISLARRRAVGAAGSPPRAEADGGGLGAGRPRWLPAWAAVAYWCRRCGRPPNAVSAGSQLFATASVLDGYAAGVLVRHDVAGRSRSRAIRCILPASARPTHSPRPRCWASMIPIAPSAWNATASRRTGRPC